MFPFIVRRQISKLTPQELTIDASGIDHATVSIHATANLVEPLTSQRADRVRVSVELDHPLAGARDAVVRVFQGPDQVPVFVVADVVSAADRADIEDHVPQILETRTLVVAQPAEGIASVFTRTIDVI